MPHSLRPHLPGPFTAFSLSLSGTHPASHRRPCAVQANEGNVVLEVRNPHISFPWLISFFFLRCTFPSSAVVEMHKGFSKANPSSYRQPSTGQRRRQLPKPVILPFPTPAFAPLLDKFDKLTATIIQLPAPIVSSSTKPTAHHLPDADHSSPFLGCETPTCTIHGSRRAILIPTERSPKPLS
ncbi:hypothetical protein B0H13DRAFT_2323925 [Mycena leptocephala]|nr:hypothetical protein B0H13DRAFT_2323925 [Mycena leptocephala]